MHALEAADQSSYIPQVSYLLCNVYDTHYNDYIKRPVSDLDLQCNGLVMLNVMVSHLNVLRGWKERKKEGGTDGGRQGEMEGEEGGRERMREASRGGKEGGRERD